MIAIASHSARTTTSPTKVSASQKGDRPESVQRVARQTRRCRIASRRGRGRRNTRQKANAIKTRRASSRPGRKPSVWRREERLCQPAVPGHDRWPKAAELSAAAANTTTNASPNCEERARWKNFRQSAPRFLPRCRCSAAPGGVNLAIGSRFRRQARRATRLPARRAPRRSAPPSDATA